MGRRLLILATTPGVDGKEIAEVFGIVTGNTVRAKHIGRDIMASIKNIVGGEMTGYTELLQEARGEATARMEQQASSLGANAIVNVRYGTSSVIEGGVELFAYGTAVRLR